MTIYVKNGFQQLVEDSVIESFSFGAEVETSTPDHYADYVISDMDEQFEAEKLKFCIANREEAYAKLNQDEMRYDDLINGTSTWQDAIADIKATFPKPV